MSEDNDCSNSLSGEFLKGKKKALKKITKLGKRPYNKGKNNPIKYQNKTKREYVLDKSTNYSKLAKEKFLYLPYHPLPDLTDFVGEIIEVRIASEYLSHNNKAFNEKRIWGSDIYTSDSDAVCILQHSGYFEIKELSPTNIQGVSVFFRVTKSRSTYNSTQKNGIKSRKLNSYQGHSIKPEKYTLLEKFGTQSELLEMAAKMPKISLYERHKPLTKKLVDYQDFREFNVCFNFSNELWWAYSLPAIADKGGDFKDFLSWKLKDKVLYIENNKKRYEISRNIFDHLNDDYLFDEFETFRFSEVVEPFEKDGFFMQESTVPLEAALKHVNVLFDRIDWHEFYWGEDSLRVKNEVLIDKIKAFNFYGMTESKRNSYNSLTNNNNSNHGNNNENNNLGRNGNSNLEKNEKNNSNKNNTNNNNINNNGQLNLNNLHNNGIMNVSFVNVCANNANNSEALNGKNISIVNNASLENLNNK